MTEKNEVEQAKTAYWKAKYEESVAESAQLREEAAKLRKAFADLDAQISIQAGDQFTEKDGYMAGLLNGMLLAKANLSGEYKPISYKDEKSASQSLLIEKLRLALEPFAEEGKRRRELQYRLERDPFDPLGLQEKEIKYRNFCKDSEKYWTAQEALIPQKEGKI